MTNFVHVMVQGVNKEYIFNNERFINEYLRIMRASIKKYDIELMAYCIMNNHAHMLLYTENIETLGKYMKEINFTFARFYNDMKKRVGVLFRNRYRAEPIYDNKYLLNCIKYIHDNPVKAKMVSKCEEYPYSSYKDFMYNTGVTQNSIMLELFGSSCDYMYLFKELSEQRFMEMEDDEGEIIKTYIEDGILDFKREYPTELFEIFHDKVLLKKLICYLNENHKIKYNELCDYFDIPKETLKYWKKGK